MKSILCLQINSDITKTIYKILGELVIIPRVGECIMTDCIHEDFLIGAEEGIVGAT